MTTAMTIPACQLRDVSHRYGAHLALDEVSFDVAPAEVVSVLGPSGCGKSTLLRLIAGLEPLGAGRIVLAGDEVARPGRSVPPEQRRVGLVFQDYALFPHLSIADNVRFGMRAPQNGSSREEALALLARVGLAARADSFPNTLSGGEQQRVALVRSLATHPSLMLMDEPFAGLDTGLRAAVREQTLDVLKERNCAAIIVTHDASEAMEISDRVLVLRAGRLEQDGSPAAIYLEPSSPFVGRFFGGSSTLSGEAVGPSDVRCGPLRLHPGNARFVSASAPAASDRGGSGLPLVEILVRPEAVQLVADRDTPQSVPATVLKVIWTGETVRVKVALQLSLQTPSDAIVVASFPTWLWHRRPRGGAVGDVIHVAFEPSGVHVFQSPQEGAGGRRPEK